MRGSGGLSLLVLAAGLGLSRSVPAGPAWAAAGGTGSVPIWAAYQGTLALATRTSGRAQESPRPPLCDDAVLRHDPWRRATDPRLGGYCLALARGYSWLRVDPVAAIEQARRAASLAPAEAAPLVLEARAYAERLEHSAAREAFTRARALHGFTVSGPEALHAYARSATLGGERELGRELYRKAVVLGRLFMDPERGLSVYLEAAAVVFLGGAESRSELGAYLAEAERLNDSTRVPETTRAMRVLQLLAFGEAESAAVLSQTLDLEALERELGTETNRRPSAVVLVPEITELLLAIEQVPGQPLLDSESWRSAIAGLERVGSPWGSFFSERVTRSRRGAFRRSPSP